MMALPQRYQWLMAPSMTVRQVWFCIYTHLGTQNRNRTILNRQAHHRVVRPRHIGLFERRSGLFVPSAPNRLFGTEECCRRPKLNLYTQSHIYHSTFHTMTEGQATIGPKGVQAITNGMEESRQMDWFICARLSLLYMAWTITRPICSRNHTFRNRRIFPAQI